MIKISKVSKSFDNIAAISDITLEIADQHVFGMLGTNGAGKSTLLRMISGVLKPDAGAIEIDGEIVWDHPSAKEKFFYISDDQFFFPNATPQDMAKYYRTFYSNFDMEKFQDYLTRFGLDATRKIKTYSKGMKKQLSIIIGLSTNVPYLLCDETFDGLDPVMRQGIKSIFASEIEERGLTPIIASHNLRELEDICDTVGLLHKGGVLLSKDLEDLKCNIQKVQFVLPEDSNVILQELFSIVSQKQHGRLNTLVVRGERSDIEETLAALHPIYAETLPLSLEEIFIVETEVVGYDIKNLIL